MDHAPPESPIKVLWPAVVFLAAVFFYVAFDVISDEKPHDLPDPPPPVVDITDLKPPEKKDDPVIIDAYVSVSPLTPVTFGSKVAVLQVQGFTAGAVVATGEADPATLDFAPGAVSVEVSLGSFDPTTTPVERWVAVLEIDYSQTLPSGTRNGILTDSYYESTAGASLGEDDPAHFTATGLEIPLAVSRFESTSLAPSSSYSSRRSAVIVAADDDPFRILAQENLTDANFRLAGDGRPVFQEKGPLRDARAVITLPLDELEHSAISVSVLLWIDDHLVSRSAVLRVRRDE